MLAPTGCSWNPELDEARRQVAACRLEIEALKREQAREDPGAAYLKAQRDRAQTQCEELKNEIAGLKSQLREQAKSAESGASPLGRQLDEQRRELEAALAAVRRSREEWEQSLADRQREIDMLTNRVERLQRELEAARRRSARPGTKPSG